MKYEIAPDETLEGKVGAERLGREYTCRFNPHMEAIMKYLQDDDGRISEVTEFRIREEHNASAKEVAQVRDFLKDASLTWEEREMDPEGGIFWVVNPETLKNPKALQKIKSTFRAYYEEGESGMKGVEYFEGIKG